MGGEPTIRSDTETECERLRVALAQLRSENQWLKRCLGELLFEEIEIDDDEMLGLAESQPTFETLIAQLEAMQR